MSTRNFIARVAGALILGGLFGSGVALASSPITVNKQFAPNSVPLGGSSVVTVTLQNSNTTTAATILTFQDNLDTTGTPPVAVIDTAVAPVSSCGFVPTITGADNNTITMNGGTIPMAPSSTTPGSCTITFTVFGNHAGAGLNEIHGDDSLPSDVTTSLGDPANSIFQQLTVAGTVATVSASGPISTIFGPGPPPAGANQGTLVFTITNPAVGVALTNASFTITGNSINPFTIVSATNSCGGATVVTLGTTITTTGATVPANGSCNLTIVTQGDGAASTVNYQIVNGNLTDDQGVSNSGGVSTQDNFVAGTPTVTKSFNPVNVLPGGTTTLTININNALTGQTLDAASIIDPVSSASLTVAAGAVAVGNSIAACGTLAPTLTGQTTGTATITGLTIGSNSTCSISFPVVVSAVPGSVTNTIPALYNPGVSGFTSTEVSSQQAQAQASLTVTGTGGNIGASKSFNPTQVGPFTPTQVTLTFQNLAGATGFTAGSFTDPLPAAPQPMQVVNNATYPVTTTNCGAGVITAVNGSTTVSGAGLTIPVSPGSCVVTFYTQFTTSTNGSNITDTNTLSAAQFTGSGGVVHPALPSANIIENPNVTLTNFVLSGTNLVSQAITVQASLNDPSGTADTGLVATINLVPGKVMLSPTPNYVFGAGCPAGLTAASITPGPGPNIESFTVNVGAISATCTINYDVINEAGFSGSSGVPASPTYYSTATGGIGHSVSFTATNQVNFATTTLNVTKKFTPNSIQAGSVATTQIGLTVNNVATFTQTQANGVTFSDSLPANVNFAAAPNITFTGCQVAGQPAPVGTITGTTIAFTNISLFTTSSTATQCTVTFDVTSSILAAPINHIPAGTITSTTPGVNNPLAAAATLTVAAGVAIQKSFTSATLQIGGTTYIRFLLFNSETPSVLNGGAIVDNMPATLVLASTTLGPAQGGDPALCGGSITAGAVGSSSFTLGGLTLPGTTGGGVIPGECVVYVSVGAAPGAAPGPASNTIGVGQLTIGGYSNQTPSTASSTLTSAPSLSIAKAFNPTQIAPGSTSVLTITVSNTAAGAAPLTGMAFTDTLPVNVTVAPVPATSTTCGGTVTAAAGGSAVVLNNGSLGASKTCTVTVTVTSSTNGIWTNTIQAGAVTTAQSASNTAPAQAILTVGITVGVGITKSFLNTVLVPGGVTAMTVTIVNNATTAIALTNMGVIDTLPAGLTIASTPGASTTCTGGTATASAGGNTLALSGASIAVNGTCTITANVTGSTAGTFTNTIPVSTITSSQGSTNGSPAQSAITIGQPSLGVTKTSSPSGTNVSPGQTIAYTVIARNSGSQDETNAHISDALKNAALVPGSVTLNGSAAADGIVLSAQPFGTLAVGATATITYNATVSVSALAGALVTNTATLGGDQACTGAACSATSAANTIQPPVLTASKLIDGMASESVLAGQTVVYSAAIANIGSGTALNTVMTDVLPTGLTFVPGSVTLNNTALASATVAGQTVTVPIGTLSPATTANVTFRATIGPTMGNASNTVSVMASGMSKAVVSAAALAHQVPATIVVTKTTPSTTVTTGDRVNFTITATPVGSISYGTTTIVDTLPDYEVYAPGTSRVAGKAVEPTVVGHVMTWTVPSLTGTLTITYSIAIAPGAQANTKVTNLVNVTAVAPGGAGFGRGFASAAVLVVGSTFGNCYPITGRVYLDVNGSGHFQDPDVGLHSVHIFIDSGETSTTDSTGRYDFPCVHPGMHALRLDATTLPPGIIPYDDRNIDSEKSTRRLVHHIFDTYIIEDINFAVTGTPKEPLRPGGSGAR